MSTRFEFLTKSFFDTLTQATVNSGTASVANIFSRDPTQQYISFNFDNDLTTATLQIDFDNTLSISRMVLIGTNLQDFTIYHSGVTANTLSFSTTADTTVSDWSSNSNSAIYLAFDTIQASQINIDMLSTQVANSEKIVSYFAIADTNLDFARLPDSKGYKVAISAQDVVHKLSDGGMRINTKGEKFTSDISLKAVPLAMRDSLRIIHQTKDDFIYTSFGTTTGFDGTWYPVVWIGDFEFLKFQNNNPAAGFIGKIKIREVPS